MKKRKSECRLFNSSIIILLFFISGCASTTGRLPSANTGIDIKLPGFYHCVKKGETLWRISRIYGVRLEELLNINKISDVTIIEVGQNIFIPRINKTQPEFSSSTAEDFIWPLKGKIICGFADIYQNKMANKGVNILPAGSLNVHAARSGKVVFTDTDFLCFGKTIIIDHGNDFSTVYARCEEIFVSRGDMVNRGTVIARVGYAGRDKKKYLHFQIRKGHLPQNPSFYLPR